MTVKEYRERLGLSLGTFARTAGVARTTLERIEAGHGCSAATALALERASHGLITLRDLVPGEEDGDSPAGKLPESGPEAGR